MDQLLGTATELRHGWWPGTAGRSRALERAERLESILRSRPVARRPPGEEEGLVSPQKAGRATLRADC